MTEFPVTEELLPTTVTGSNSPLSVAHTINGDNLPGFNRTDYKKRYADELRMWFEMMSSYNTNNELKIELLNLGFKIDRCCAEQDRNIRGETRSLAILNLEGNETDDAFRTKLVQKVIALIATGPIPEKLHESINT